MEENEGAQQRESAGTLEEIDGAIPSITPQCARTPGVILRANQLIDLTLRMSR